MRRFVLGWKMLGLEQSLGSRKVPEGQFDFLGHTFGLMYSARTGKAYLGYRPSKKSIKRMVENIHALTTRSWTWQQLFGLACQRRAPPDLRDEKSTVA
jgi:hypothetical protein